MKIIIPCHNIPATAVNNWKEIKQDALELRDFIHNGKFIGNYQSAYAISHTQVSDKPKSFFVVNEKIEGGFLPKEFGSWCIINAKIVENLLYTVPFEDACMNFPFRKPKLLQRYYYIKVEYYVPSLFGMLRKKVKKIKGIPAFVVQHEIEHAEGKNIYGK